MNPRRHDHRIGNKVTPNFVRSMLDRAVLTLGEDQIIEIENAIRSCDESTAKDIIYNQFIKVRIDIGINIFFYYF